MWHHVLSMEVFCTVNNPAQPHEYQNYCGKLNAGLTAWLPTLLAGAKRVSSKAFRPTTTVDVSAASTCDYKIFGVGADLAERLHKAMEGGDLFVGVNVDVALVDEVKQMVCKHAAGGGKTVTVCDCVATACQLVASPSACRHDGLLNNGMARDACVCACSFRAPAPRRLDTMQNACGERRRR